MNYLVINFSTYIYINVINNFGASSLIYVVNFVSCINDKIDIYINNGYNLLVKSLKKID